MQWGGLKLRDKNKTGFAPVYDMIEHGTLDVLTYESLKGFLFTLDVEQDASEYFNLRGSRFLEPVTNYILKFSVITDTNDENLAACGGVEKSSESAESYLEEARLQQNCWLRSISGGHPAICPSVANFSLFDNSESTKLLNFLQTKPSSTKLQIVLPYLVDCCRDPSKRLGVIVMPRVANCTPFFDFVQKATQQEQTIAYAMVIAQIVRLFVQLNVMHFDLHPRNALVSGKGDTLKTMLIDFGRASDIRTGQDDEYLTVREKKQTRTFMDVELENILNINRRAGVDEEGELERILAYMAKLDFDKNRAIFGAQINQAQMGWYEDYKTVKTKKANIPVLAYKMLVSMITADVEGDVSILPATIQGFIRDGYFVNFGKQLDEYYVPVKQSNLVNPTVNPVVNVPVINPFASEDKCVGNPGACTISGGTKRRKKRNTKRNRRNKSKKRNTSRFSRGK